MGLSMDEAEEIQLSLVIFVFTAFPDDIGVLLFKVLYEISCCLFSHSFCVGFRCCKAAAFQATTAEDLSWRGIVNLSVNQASMSNALVIS